MRTAQQEINYKAALLKLADELEAFVEVARRNGRKIHSIGWNHRPIYRTNGHKRRLSITVMGPEGSNSRENPPPPVEHVRKPRNKD